MELEFVRYCRSKNSGFGNSSSNKNLSAAWEETKKFLNEYTNFYLPIPPSIELWSNSDGISSKLLTKIVKKYGKTDTDNGTPYRWFLPKEINEDLVSLVLENEQYKNNKMGPIVAHLPFYFTWKNINEDLLIQYKDVFEHYYQGSHGKFNLVFSEKLFIQSEYIIPYSANSENFSSFLALLKSNLPYKISTNSLMYFESKTLKNGKTKYKSMGKLESIT